MKIGLPTEEIEVELEKFRARYKERKDLTKPLRILGENMSRGYSPRGRRGSGREEIGIGEQHITADSTLTAHSKSSMKMS